MECAEASCAAVKPQMAWFEILGAPGMQALRTVALKARRLGLPLILDGKRNDIGHTAAQYARAYLGPARGPEAAAVPADALTVTPYLGSDGLRPFVQRCLAHHKGLFVLAATSNPSGAEIQDLALSGGGFVADRAAALIRTCGDGLAGAFGYGPVGAVVGATRPEMLTRLRGAMPEALFLLPGFGAQGAQAKDIKTAFDQRGLGAVINASRSLLFGPADSPDGENFAKNIANRAESMRQDIESALGLQV
jgi:orotidine-5'-phosphate decarboxylase